MGLVELLEQIREEYLDQLLATVHEMQARPGARVITEPALRDETGKLVIEGVLELPARTDIAVLQDEQLSEIFNVDKSPTSFDPVEFDWGKTLHVEMGPFAWHGLSITIPADDAYVWTPLQDWFWKWFHDEEEETETPGLLDAVHFLSDPLVDGDVVQLSVDLGTAPIPAFEELLDAISASGVSLCALGAVLSESEAGE